MHGLLDLSTHSCGRLFKGSHRNSIRQKNLWVEYYTIMTIFGKQMHSI